MSGSRRTGFVCGAIAAAIGITILAAAYRMDTRWCERHVLAVYSVALPDDAALVRHWRAAWLTAGVIVLFVCAPLAHRWGSRRTPREAIADAARIALSLALSVVAIEIGLRVLGLPRPKSRALLVEHNIGEKDARYGWLYVAGTSRQVRTAGHLMEYDIDANHDRAASTDFVADPARPTIVFAGESITAGHGLLWEESFPAIVGGALDVQVLDLATHGYGMDQAYLRLHDELPKMQRPVAIVSFVIPIMVWRMSRDDHPALSFDSFGAPLVTDVHGFWHDMHLANAWRELVPYHGDRELDLAARLVRETAKLARDRGAAMLFVAPSFGGDGPRPDRWLVDALFVDQGVDVMDASFGFVPIAGEIHPDAPSTRRLADAVLAALRPRITRR